MLEILITSACACVQLCTHVAGSNPIGQKYTFKT